SDARRAARRLLPVRAGRDDGRRDRRGARDPAGHRLLAPASGAGRVQRRDRRAGRSTGGARRKPREGRMSAARDPVRLVADASVPDAERALLRHGVAIAPPHDAEARVWQGLAGALGIAAAASAAEASAKTIAAGTKATAAGSVGLTGAKIIVVAVALAGL